MSDRGQMKVPPNKQHPLHSYALVLNSRHHLFNLAHLQMWHFSPRPAFISVHFSQVYFPPQGSTFQRNSTAQQYRSTKRNPETPTGVHIRRQKEI